MCNLSVIALQSYVAHGMVGGAPRVLLFEVHGLVEIKRHINLGGAELAGVLVLLMLVLVLVLVLLSVLLVLLVLVLVLVLLVLVLMLVLVLLALVLVLVLVLLVLVLVLLPPLLTLFITIIPPDGWLLIAVWADSSVKGTAQDRQHERTPHIIVAARLGADIHTLLVLLPCIYTQDGY
jgi:hypothetical protein